MFKTKTPEKIYDELLAEGSYKDAELEDNEIEKILELTAEDYKTGKDNLKLKNVNYRVVFNIHYDVLRELCDQLMRFKNQKTSNHQGLFAFIILKFPELDLDWKFLETIRTIRNQNKYEGMDITKDMWKQVELQFDLYIAASRKEVEKRLKSL